jgi:hypothetical protein
MSHCFKAINEPNVGDIIQTMECEGCGLRQVINVGTKEPLSHLLLELIPDCETLLIRSVIDT